MSEGFRQFVAERTRMSRLFEDARTGLQHILSYKHEDIYMDELLEQIAAGEELSRDIDAAIAVASGLFAPPWKHVGLGRFDIEWSARRPTVYNMEGPQRCPEYTRSTDAAMTLIPKGWGGSLHIEERGKWAIVKLGRSYPTNAEVTVEARTLPRAICLAALKAGMVGE